MSEDQKGYNGWTNYETWVTKLWMDNDQASYNYFNDLARENRKSPYDLSELIKDHFEENNPLNNLPAGVYHDLMNAALSEVNWREIAETLINDLDEEE